LREVGARDQFRERPDLMIRAIADLGCDDPARVQARGRATRRLT
jgi:hypothetical protein